MSTLVKLKDIAVHMGLEPAEETSLHSTPPAPANQKIAPCGQILEREALMAQDGTGSNGAKPDKKQELGITHAALPNGKTVPLLKTMLTTACERNCYYCPFRAGRNYRRTTFKPEEMATTFMQMYRAGMAEGLFLSSGIIKGGIATQDKLIDTVAILRQKHQFRGYVHLKVMPGAEKAQVERAMQLADRLSVNLEAPNDRRLADLAPKKQFFKELLRPLQWMAEIRREQAPTHTWNGRWASSTTQFVVGAVGESDVEILATSEYLYKQVGLQRAYYSAFSPVPDTPLENNAPENPWRKHRLYQASYLFRDYDFDLEEMPFSQDGNLPLDTDPKLAWAQVNLYENPVEVNRAERQELLRVPGIGPKGAATILRARRRGALRDVADLQAIGVRTKQLKPFVLLDGRRPTYQLPLPIRD